MSDEAAGEPVEAPPPPFLEPPGAAKAEEPPEIGVDRRSGGTRLEPTGDSRVDDVMARLRDLDEVPVSGHVEVFEEIHQRLQELLASADHDEPRPPMPGPAGAWRADVAPGRTGLGGPPPGHGPRP